MTPALIPARHCTARSGSKRAHRPFRPAHRPAKAPHRPAKAPHRPAKATVALAALVLAAMALTATLGVANARADVGEKIIDRCTHGQSLKGFSQAAYRQALKDMSAGTEEYSNCAQLIRQAQLEAAGAGHGGAGGPSGAGASPTAVAATPAQQQAIAHAPAIGSAPVRVGGQTIHPGVVHADIASVLSSLPTPLLATVVFLLVGLLVVAGAGIRKRIVRIRRSQ
jgi:hypothetical protein